MAVVQFTGVLPAVVGVGGDPLAFRRALEKMEIAKYIALPV
jgi:hypothetical protein